MDSENGRIWVVEMGSYSDYHVVGVFSSPENAQVVADALNGAEDRWHSDRASVAEWSIDPAVADIRAGRKPFLVHMLHDGRVERCEQWTPSSYEIGGKVEIWRRTKAPAYQGTDTPDAMMTTVWATDNEHAIKITNEHRLQWIAENRW